MGNEFGSQATLAIFTPILLQWLKARPWFPLLGYETQTLNRAVTAAVALVAGLGVFWTFDAKQGVLTVGGLTLAALGHGLLRMGQQWLFQHFVYKTIVAPPLPGALQDQARERKVNSV